jgi:hypothetical protein
MIANNKVIATERKEDIQQANKPAIQPTNQPNKIK